MIQVRKVLGTVDVSWVKIIKLLVYCCAGDAKVGAADMFEEEKPEKRCSVPEKNTTCRFEPICCTH